MTNQINERAVVLDILLELEKEDAMCHLVLRSALAKFQYLEKQERGFISRLVLGTVEQRIELDYMINQFSKTPVRKMKPVIRCILEMSVYQLKYMKQVPVSAVCNEAVKLAGKRKFVNLKGFVNGVLRNIARNLDNVTYPDKEKEPQTYLSVKYSIPEWFLSMWKKQYSYAQIEQILEGFKQENRTYIRCNTQKVSPQQLKEALQKEGIAVCDVKGLPFAFAIDGYDYIGGIEAFEQGWFQIQDISSMLVGKVAGLKEKDAVMDVCAAPGGKSINAALLNPKGMIDSRDLSDYKVSLIEDNLDRLEIENVTTKVWDATILDASSIEQADVVFADVPCSGFGIIGRKPDIKYNASLDKTESLVGLQRKILAQVWQYVRPGGYLIYSTCTINRAENEENVAWMCEQFPLERCDITADLQEYLVSDQDCSYGVQLLPGINGTDGFFIAKLQRKA